MWGGAAAASGQGAAACRDWHARARAHACERTQGAARTRLPRARPPASTTQSRRCSAAAAPPRHPPAARACHGACAEPDTTRMRIRTDTCLHACTHEAHAHARSARTLPLNTSSSEIAACARTRTHTRMHTHIRTQRAHLAAEHVIERDHGRAAQDDGVAQLAQQHLAGRRGGRDDEPDATLTHLSTHPPSTDASGCGLPVCTSSSSSPPPPPPPTHRDALGRVVEAADVPHHAHAVQDGRQQTRDVLRVRRHQPLARLLQAQQELEVVLGSHRLPAHACVACVHVCVRAWCSTVWCTTIAHGV